MSEICYTSAMSEVYDARFICPTCGRAPDVERLDSTCLPNGMLRPGHYTCRIGHNWDLTAFDLQFSPSVQRALAQLAERL
jgi:hypothetical protein